MNWGRMYNKLIEAQVRAHRAQVWDRVMSQSSEQVEAQVRNQLRSQLELHE